MKHLDQAEQVCARCERPYRPEPQDRELCCICERDARMHARFGPKWHDEIRRRRARGELIT
jgi:predicted amidophosphoribosyltransferase